MSARRMPADAVDQTVARLNEALGPARHVHHVLRSGRVVAAIGRWRHDGAEIELDRIRSSRLLFNVRGGQRLTWRGDAAQAPVSGGSIALIEPRIRATLRVAGRADTLQIAIDPEWLASAGLGHRTPDADARRFALAAQALVALSARDAASLDQIFATIAPLMRETTGGAAAAPRGGLPPAVLGRLKRWIESSLIERPDRMPSVADLAEAADLSVFHFIRAFRYSEGVTPHVWIAALRTRRAVAQLLDGGGDIADAAIANGFSSPSHFIASFRKQMSVTPGQLRGAAQAD